jgi:hypothetical protein
MYPFAPFLLLLSPRLHRRLHVTGCLFPLPGSNLQDTNGVAHVESLRRQIDHAARPVSLLDCARSLRSSWLPEKFGALQARMQPSRSCCSARVLVWCLSLPSRFFSSYTWQYLCVVMKHLLPVGCGRTLHTLVFNS